jgi:hypothetical protein
VAIHRLKQTKVAFGDLVRFASPAAKTFVITNILSTFVVPPILTALGQPHLAFLVVATPFEPFLAAGQVVVMRYIDDYKLLRRIGFEDYRKLKELRKQLLEMPERQHILTLMDSELTARIQAEGGPLWLSITRSAKATPHGVPLAELEEIVGRRTEGKTLLKSLLPQKTESRIYSLELWYFIEEDEELRNELSARILSRSRTQAAAGEAVTASDELLSRQMRELIDLRRDLYDQEVRLAATIKKQSKGLDSSEKKALKKLLTEVRDHSRAAARASTAAETELLMGRVRMDGAAGGSGIQSRLDETLDLIRKERQMLMRLEREAALIARGSASGSAALRAVFVGSAQGLPCATLFGTLAG